MTKSEIFIIWLILTSILSLISIGIGVEISNSQWRKVAVKYGHAEWETTADGGTKWKWKNNCKK